jgi:hypothetical protein
MLASDEPRNTRARTDPPTLHYGHRGKSPSLQHPGHVQGGGDRLLNLLGKLLGISEFRSPETCPLKPLSLKPVCHNATRNDIA